MYICECAKVKNNNVADERYNSRTKLQDRRLFQIACTIISNELIQHCPAQQQSSVQICPINKKAAFLVTVEHISAWMLFFQGGFKSAGNTNVIKNPDTNHKGFTLQIYSVHSGLRKDIISKADDIRQLQADVCLIGYSKVVHEGLWTQMKRFWLLLFYRIQASLRTNKGHACNGKLTPLRLPKSLTRCSSMDAS